MSASASALVSTWSGRCGPCSAEPTEGSTIRLGRAAAPSRSFIIGSRWLRPVPEPPQQPEGTIAQLAGREQRRGDDREDDGELDADHEFAEERVEQADTGRGPDAGDAGTG